MRPVIVIEVSAAGVLHAVGTALMLLGIVAGAVFLAYGPWVAAVLLIVSGLLAIPVLRVLRRWVR
jgi:hypothetical protein